jgi:hypothetical protein
MTEQEKERVPGSLVRSFLEPTPSLPFVLKRRQEDGSVKDYPFRCLCLRPAHTIDVLTASQAYAKDKELQGYGDIYRESQAHEAIQRAICQPEPIQKEEGGPVRYRPMFTSADQVRMSLTEAECARLIDCITLTKEHFNVTRDTTPEDVEKMVNALADELAGPFFLSQLDSADWPSLIYELARLVSKQWKETGRTHSSSHSSSASDPLSLESGTTGFSTLPDAQSTGDGPKLSLETQHFPLTREQAREMVRQAATAHEKKGDPDKES